MVSLPCFCIDLLGEIGDISQIECLFQCTIVIFLHSIFTRRKHLPLSFAVSNRHAQTSHIFCQRSYASCYLIDRCGWCKRIVKHRDSRLLVIWLYAIHVHEFINRSWLGHSIQCHIQLIVWNLETPLLFLQQIKRHLRGWKDHRKWHTSLRLMVDDSPHFIFFLQCMKVQNGSLEDSISFTKYFQPEIWLNICFRAFRTCSVLDTVPWQKSN